MKSLLMFVLVLSLGVGAPCGVLAAEVVSVDPEMTLAELAHAYDVRGGDLAEALGLPRRIDKQQTLRQLGVNERAVRQALATAGSVAVSSAPRLHRGGGDGRGGGAEHGTAAIDRAEHPPERQAIPDLYNYLLWPVLLAGVLWWLLWGGRVEGGRLLPVTRRYHPFGFYATLLLVVLFFGFASGKSPNPMEGLVKFVKALAGYYDDPWVKFGFLMFFSLLALVGTKLVCGWACPFGALQELIYELPLLRRLKKVRLPFVWTMSVRTLLFVLFLVFISGFAGRRWVLYHGINPFNLFGFEFSQLSIGISAAAFLLLSAVVYRPFCQLVCPFGWYAWFLEKISLCGVRIDRHACTGCGACDRACPMETARQRRLGKAWPGECFSCARCLRVCPVDAVDYGPRWRNPVSQSDVED